MFNRTATEELNDADPEPTAGLQSPARVRELSVTAPADSGAAIDRLIGVEQQIHAARGAGRARRAAREARAKAAWLGTIERDLGAACDETARRIEASGDGSVLVGLGALLGAVVTIAAEYYFNKVTLAALLELEGLAADMLAAGATAAMIALELPLLRLFAAYVRRHDFALRTRLALYGLVWLVYLGCAAVAADLVLRTAPARAEAVKLVDDVVSTGGQLAEIDGTVVSRFLASLTVFVAGAAALLAATAHVELASAGSRTWATLRGAWLRWRRDRIDNRRRAHEVEAEHARCDLDQRVQTARLEAEAWAQGQRTDAQARLQPPKRQEPSVDDTVEELLRNRLVWRHLSVSTPAAEMRKGRLLRLGARRR
jgi:hypothetical protein